jgi:hypothetical protein
MFANLVQALVTVGVVFALSEIGKRWTVLGAAVAALPLMTMLVVAKIAYDSSQGGGIAKANEFATSFFYLFWPGLLFFIVLPVLQKLGVPFWWAFGAAVVTTFAATWGVIVLLKSFGVKVN